MQAQPAASEFLAQVVLNNFFARRQSGTRFCAAGLWINTLAVDTALRRAPA
jgi:hypothetical protein